MPKLKKSKAKKPVQKTKKPILKTNQKETLRSKLQPKLQPISPLYGGLLGSSSEGRYINMKDRNDNIQNNMEATKRAFEQEQARNKLLNEQKNQLELELENSKREMKFQEQLHKNKTKMMKDIQDAREKTKEYQIINEGLKDESDISELKKQLEHEEARRAQLEHTVKNKRLELSKNALNTR